MATARLEELRARYQENPRRFFAPYANELRKTGDPAQAISICRTHLATQPGHVSGHIVLAQALHDSGTLEEASREFETALDMDPENMIALRAVGDIAAVKGEYDSARRWYQRMLEADPRNEEILELVRSLPETSSTEPLPEAVPEAAAGASSSPSPYTLLLPTTQPSGESSAPSPTVAQSDSRENGSVEAAPAKPAAEALDISGVSFDLPPAPSPVAPIPGEAMELRETFSSIAPTSPSTSSEEPLSAEADAVAPSGVESGSSRSDQESDAAQLDTSLEFDVVTSSPEAISVDESQVEREVDIVADLPLEWFSPPPPEPPAARDTKTPDWLFTTPEDQAASQADSDLPHDEEPKDTSVPWRPKPTPAAVHSDFEAAPDDWFVLPGDPADGPLGASTDSEPVESIAAPRDDLGAWFPITATSEGDAATQGPPIDELEPVVSESADAHADAPAAADTLEEAPPPEVQAAEPESMPQERDASSDFDVVEEVAPEVGAMSAPPEAIGAPEVEVTVAAEYTVIEATAPAAPTKSPEMEEPVASSGSVPEAAAVPFVTETLAELYVQQGFREEALAIYRQLVQANPSSEALRRRVEELEERTPLAGEPAPAASATAPPDLAGMSARAFFGRLARRRPSASRRESGGEPLAARSEEMQTSEAAPPFGGGASHDTPPAEPAAESSALEAPTAANEPMQSTLEEAAAAAVRRPTPSALSALFPASNPSAADLAAASSLANAFAESPSDGHLSGRPARTVDRELSLDHLFRDGAGASGEGATLDSFFGGDSGGSTSQAAAEPSPSVDESGAEDLQQFTKWLEGLKKK